MKISLLISFLLHLIMFLVFQKTFPSFWTEQEFRIYRVDVVRLSNDNLQKEENPENERTPLREKQLDSGETEADTISLDTKDKRYVSYAKAIKERIQKNWQYPLEARKKGLEGRLMLLFSLERNGDLSRVEIKEKSGHDILDEEATRAIFASAPFPPFPDQIKVGRLHIKAAFDYRLK